MCVSNVRGAPMRLHIDGGAMTQMAGFLPPPPGVSLGVVVATFEGRVQLSVASDTAQLASAEELLQLVMREVEDYGALAAPAPAGAPAKSKDA